jgi:hypothetical protein
MYSSASVLLPFICCMLCLINFSDMLLRFPLFCGFGFLLCLFPTVCFFLLSALSRLFFLPFYLGFDLLLFFIFYLYFFTVLRTVSWVLLFYMRCLASRVSCMYFLLLVLCSLCPFVFFLYLLSFLGDFIFFYLFCFAFISIPF